ncbi:TPA: DUF2612 domain-containing protein [Serratia marcescens]|uniref:DUF2612 domain-containing protein n=1 Tax=Serratia TaxID=613 RepID=UPI002DB92C24|nr:DUF2612 domain-containing protein [Serratia marcescens]MEB7509163.1 DUF2612 domain-containing protein [Serratia marcescens]
MPTLDVTDVLFDPEFCDTSLIVTRNQQTVDDDGFATNAPVKMPFAGVVNHWDGTTETLSDVYQIIFPDGKTKIFAVDNFDMTMSVYITGDHITPVMKAVIELGYLDIKPSTVRIKNYTITTESGPLFGFDIDNEFISGFDKGAWGTLLGASHG